MKALYRILKELNVEKYVIKRFGKEYIEGNHMCVNWSVTDLLNGKRCQIRNSVCELTIEDDEKTIERMFVLKVGLIRGEKCMCKIKFPTYLNYSKDMAINLYLIISFYFDIILYLIINNEKEILTRDINHTFNLLKFYYESKTH